MACAEFDMSIRGVDEDEGQAHSRNLPAAPTVIKYQATEIVETKKKPLHDLMKKQPCVLGSMQTASGFFSVSLGIVFALSQEINGSLFNLFRVSQLTGVMFMFAGVVSMLLSKHPRLLPISLRMNIGCISVTLVAVCLTITDLITWNNDSVLYDMLKSIEVLSLCVMLLEVFLSALLCFWFSKQKIV